MTDKFETIICRLFFNAKESFPAVSLDMTEQFEPNQPDKLSIVKTLNICFLILLSGRNHSLYQEAEQYLSEMENKPEWTGIIKFYCKGLKLIKTEIKQKIKDDASFREKINNLYLELPVNTEQQGSLDIYDTIWNLFFPEGVSLLNLEKRAQKIAALRGKRKINITRLNPAPILNPAAEILFSSNILITVPLDSMPVNNLNVNRNIKSKLVKIIQEEQQYWYDHPIPIGIDSHKNELIHGLSGLSDMLEYEIEQGNAGQDTTLDCLLSVSVTHSGLHGIVKDYLHDELSKSDRIKRINIYLFTENDTRELICNILIPLAQKFLDVKDSDLDSLNEILGVDGEYGRHFSFLKAIAVFWHVFINSKIQATYKIDLDQVFPQRELIEQTGSSVFDHFKTPLWGACGIDSCGNEVELGMIAGAVINAEDMDKSIFYPDVSFPRIDDLNSDKLIFYSHLPQALSTEAEMIVPDNKDRFNQMRSITSRVHILGGMSGILVHALRKYRPFTPTFITRAEDQAYLLSVLFAGKSYLRCLNKAGLIMRHDKKAFIGDVLKAAEIGKMIGDYNRILLYSCYANALPYGVRKIKEQVDPFTGCFISYIPFTVVYLRFALKVASFFHCYEKKQDKEGLEFLEQGAERLSRLIDQLTDDPDVLKKRFQREKRAWHLFYDILDVAEQKLKEGDSFVREKREDSLKLITKCKV
jgi:hypothetical protein